MPKPDNSNQNRFVAFFKGFKDKCQYLLASKSPVEIYDLYFEGEFLRVIDEDFFTLLRIPEAIDTGDILNHYDYNGINNWIAHHPYFVVPFLACSALVGGSRVVQMLASAPAYPKTISEFLALIRQDSQQDDTDVSPDLEKDKFLLNKICDDLKIPYYYQIFTVKKRRKKKAIETQPLLAGDNNKTASTNSNESNEEDTHENQQVLILCKRHEPNKTIPEPIATQTQPNWFERTYQKIANSKFVEFVLTPPWKALNRAAYSYWILWFGAVIVSAFLTGSLVLTATGTVAVTTAALAIVIGIPTAIFFSFFGIELIDKFWPKKKSNNEIELDELNHHKIVDNKSEKENVFSLIGKALALRFHTTQQQTVLNQTFRQQQSNLANESIDSDNEKAGYVSFPRITGDDVDIDGKISTGNTAQNNQQEVLSKSKTPESSSTQDNSLSKKRLSWQSFTKFCEGYVRSTFCVWFATSVVTSFAIKFGAMAVAGALSATVIGIPVSLLISFSVGMTVGGLFAVSGGTELSLAEKEKQAFLAANPELQPEAIKQKESQWKSLKQKIKSLEQQHNELVEKNHYLISQLNKLPQKDQKNNIISIVKDDNLSTPLPIHRKNNYHALKQNHIAYHDVNQSTFSKVIDYVSTAIGNAGRMGYITRSLMIGGMITLLALSFAHPLGFITGPAVIAAAVGMTGIAFAAATVVDRHYQQQMQKEEINNLKLRLFEIKEKETLHQGIENQCNALEIRNQRLRAQIEANETEFNNNNPAPFASEWEKHKESKTSGNWSNIQNFFSAKQKNITPQNAVKTIPDSNIQMAANFS